jgi:phage portal protein BeeE
MSWIDPILRDVQGDSAAAEHKLKFFTNGATPNMVVSMDPSIKPDDFERWVKIFRESTEGVSNAYKTLILGAGATTSVVGSDLRQIQFKDTTSAGEVRICAAARVPPIVAGMIAGLESATYANFAAARRAFADGTVRPLWRNFCGSMARIVDVPTGAELWYDDRDIPWLAEDVKDAAAIQAVEAGTIAKLIQEGYEPESVVKAVQNSNWDLLVHTGLVSVQLHPGDGSGMAPAGTAPGEPTTNGAGAVPASAA